MKLTHEYNEYVIGYVVTDLESGKSVNFQLEKTSSNHPSPDFVFRHSCQGDETSSDWSEEDLDLASCYIDEQDDVNNLLTVINEIKDSDEGDDKLNELFMSGDGVYEYDFNELLESLKNNEK